jgi:hypothetical protein
MSNFHVGQLVCCVDAGLSPSGYEVLLVEGAVYTVSGIEPANDEYDEDGLHLIGVPGGQDPECDPSYRASRFRPAKLASKEVFDQLTAPFKRENAREDA